MSMRATAHRSRGLVMVYGSPAGLYRLIVESTVGAEARGGQTAFCAMPAADWQKFKVHYRYRETVYHIVVPAYGLTAGDGTSVTVDGVEQHEPDCSPG